MEEKYIIDIVDGKASSRILKGTYGITSDIPGFDNTTILPTTVLVNDLTTTLAFTISATGTLKIRALEQGTTDVPIVGATFIRCNEDGSTCGTLITTDLNGYANFNNIPFDATTGVIFYYKQLSSDLIHEFDPAIKNISLTTASTNTEVFNTKAALIQFELNDPNYLGYKIPTGTLSLKQ